MAAKDVKFSGEARDKMMRGVDILANAVKVTVSRSAAGGNPVSTVFTRLFGIDGVDLEAEAIAAKVRDPICLLALEQTGRDAVIAGRRCRESPGYRTPRTNSRAAARLSVQSGCPS